MKRNIFFFIYLLFSNIIFCQDKKEKEDIAIEQKQYAKAIDIINNTIVNEPSKSKYIKLYKCYKELRDFEMAYNSIKLAKKYKEFDIEDQKELFYILKILGKNEEARKLLDSDLPISFVRKEEKILDSIQKWKNNITKVDLKLLSINTDYNEFNLVPFTKGKYIFSSDRINTNGKSKAEINKLSFLDLYIIDTGIFNKNIIEYSKIKDKKSVFHDGTCWYSKELKKLFKSKNYSQSGKLIGSKDNLSKLKLEIATLDNEDSIISVIDFPFNNIEYSVAHPFLSEDGKKLYFVSDMPGGFGATDIYYCNINDNGSFGDPINLGPNVNTKAKEMFPYVSDQGNLFFASEGHTGFGGLDLFVCENINGYFSYPQNLGSPINSSYDDFSLIFIDSNNKKGFFTSNRPDVFAKDNIYFFNYDNTKVAEKEKPEEKIDNDLKSMIVWVRDAEDNSLIDNVDLTIFNQTKNDSNKYKTSNGGSAKVLVSQNFNYKINAFKSDYLNNGIEDIDVTKNTLILYLTKKEINKVFQIKNIYYDFNKANILPQAYPNLNKLVDLLSNNPEINIELSSHTDSRGGNDFNYNLSQRRAESVVEYLEQNNISRNRLIAKGYGESKPINNCVDGVVCSENEYLANRRTEFKILSISQNLSQINTDRGYLSQNRQVYKEENTFDDNMDKYRKIESNISNQENNYYTIQIASFNSPNYNNEFSNDLKQINVLDIGNNRYIAVSGKFSSIENALTYKKSILKYVPDAFPIKISNGKRILLK